MLDEARVLGGRYRLGSVIGRGGTGLVRAGHDLTLDRPVALKMLHPEVALQESVRKRFRSEARLAASLAHRNIVSVFDTGEEASVPYIVMELLSGRTLHDEIAAGPMTPAAGRELALQVLAALHVAHARGIIHRDIKPGNILVSEHGDWKVGDFGIAKALQVGTGDLTTAGMVVGTPAYLAPERLLGEEATVRSDLYAFGVVVYESLSGHNPFRSEQPGAAASAILGNSPSPLHELRPDVDGTLCAAVDRCLEKDPADRFGSTSEIVDAISGWPEPAKAPGSTRVQPAPEPTEMLPSAERPGPAGIGDIFRRRRRPVIAAIWAIAAAALLAVVIALGAADHNTTAKTQPTSPPTSVTQGLPPAFGHALQNLQQQVKK